MFVRAKKSGAYEYLQLVHNERVDGKVRQQVLATLGRLDVLQQTGQIDALVASCGRFAQHTAVLDAHRQGQTEAVATVKIGPSLVFERLWKTLGLPDILESLLTGRRFEFAVERAVFLTVLHRLFDPGSDRAAEVWRTGYALAGCQELDLQHLYRTMGWLKADLDALSEITVVNAGKSFVIRSQTRGDAGKALQAVGVALGPTIRLAE